MLEVRVKELQNQVDGHSIHNESLNRRLDTFRRKEAAEKEATEEDDDEEVDQKVLPLGSSDDDDPVSPIRFPKVMR
jgi:hypothetical protein